MASNWEEFRNNIKNITGPRVHKISGSLGVYDAYKWIRKHKWLNIPRPLKEHEFYSIIRTVNKYLSDNFLNGEEITLPCSLGTLEIRKKDARKYIKDGKLKTNLPIDWDSTLKLWYEDKEAYKNKTLLRAEEKEIYKLFYNKNSANFNNKGFYEFSLNRNIKLKLKRAIKNRTLFAFKSY